MSRCPAASTLKAQQTAVVSDVIGNKVYLTTAPAALSPTFDTLFGRGGGQVQGSVGALNWYDVPSNGMHPSVDVIFAFIDDTGRGPVAAASTLTADSLVLNKDGIISRQLELTHAVQLGDSIEVTGQGPSYLANTRVTNGCAGCMRATSFSERRGASAGVM